MAAAVLAAETTAQFAPSQRGQPVRADQLVNVRVITDRAEVGPGETFHVLAVFDIQQPWHIYWKNPGEAGALPPSVDLTVPDGFTVGDIRWPRPKRINSPAGEMFCYENQLALFVPVTAPAELEDGEVTIETAVRFAVCDADRCLFGRNTAKPTIRTTSSAASGNREAAAPSQRNAEFVERHLKRLPIDINDSGDVTIALHDEKLVLTAPAHGFDRATFFPADAPGVSYGKPTMSFEDDRVTVTVPLTINPNNFRSGPPMVGGLLALGRENNDPSYEGAIALREKY